MAEKNQEKDQDREKEKQDQEEEELTEERDVGSHEPYAFVEDSPFGFVEVDTDKNELAGNPLDEENMDASLYIGTDPEAVIDDMAEFTDDPDVLEDLAERQQKTAGQDQLYGRLSQHHSQTPDLSGDDIDADWESANQSGEETVGGTTPTPDQDIVDELGEAVGLEYEEEEPLDTYGKLQNRDIDRWELDPASADDLEEEDQESEEERIEDEIDEFIEEQNQDFDEQEQEDKD